MEVSWYQQVPKLSLRFIREAGIRLDEPVIDVGGGASTLVDCLHAADYSRLAVLDISGQALALARERLGDHASEVEWFEEDVTWFQPPHHFALWHDRAVFHFLTGADERRRYVDVLKRALHPRGQAVMATFALDGPRKCSGLDVVRYDANALMGELGEGFTLIAEASETHVTPAEQQQKFAWFHLGYRTEGMPSC